MSSSSWFTSSKNGGPEEGPGGLALEVTVLSAESLRLPPTYSPLPRRLRPYVAVSSSADCSSSSTDVASSSSSSGAGEHSWESGDARLVVAVGAGFLEGRDDVRVAVFSESGCARRLVAGGDTPLGWCRVPAADVLDGLRPPRALRRLSYSLRCPRSFGAGHGVVHLAVRVIGDVEVVRAAAPVQPGWCRVAMGIPVSGSSAAVSAVVGTPSPWAWGWSDVTVTSRGRAVEFARGDHVAAAGREDESDGQLVKLATRPGEKIAFPSGLR